MMALISYKTIDISQNIRRTKKSWLRRKKLFCFCVNGMIEKNVEAKRTFP